MRITFQSLAIFTQIPEGWYVFFLAPGMEKAPLRAAALAFHFLMSKWRKRSDGPQ